MRISDWSSDVCSSDLIFEPALLRGRIEWLPVGVVGGDDPFDRREPILEPAGGVVQVVEQFLVLAGQRRRLLPLGDIVEEEPGKSNDDAEDAHTHPKISNRLNPPKSEERRVGKECISTS